MLENAENLLTAGNNKDRKTISYHIESGSVKHVFKTSIQYIIGFNAIIGEINKVLNIDFLDLESAKALENIQEMAVKRYHTFNIKTSLAQSNELSIDQTTKFYRTESIWANAEFYFYGKVTNAGGKDKANIHLLTEKFGTLRIQTSISFLEQYNENILYKTFGIRVNGKQNSETGEIDKSTLKFIELIDYQAKYEEDYLKSLRDKARKSWLGKIDPDNWLSEIRGGYDA